MTDEVSATSPVPALAFSVLGAIEVYRDGHRCDVGGPKQRAALALLVVRTGHRVSTESLIDEIYGEKTPSGARRSVQTFISNLRREVGDAIVRASDGYQLDAATESVDSLLFESLLAEGTRNIATDPADASATLRRALALWSGHPFADVEHREVLHLEATRLMELRQTAIEARIEADLALGRHHELIAELEALTQEYPYREGLRMHHMVALYRSGRQTDALRAYTKTRDVLLTELGIDPSPALQALEGQILGQDQRLRHAGESTVARRTLVAIDIVSDVTRTTVSAQRRADSKVAVSDLVAHAITAHDGQLRAQRLDTVFASFETTDSALQCATDIVTNAPGGRFDAVRIAIDAGDVAIETSQGLQGPVVTRVAGLVALANPGQLLLSSDAQSDAAAIGGWTLRGLGSSAIPHLDRQERVYQLVLDGVQSAFPPLRIENATPALPGGIRSMPGYELRSRIDEGRGWTLWRAYQPSVGREVALKVIDPELSNRPEFVRRFEIEALSIARLDHPNVVPLYDYWRDLSGAYLATRWMRAPRLDQEIESRRLREAEVGRLVEGIGSAIASAHSIGIAHGAISPSAIFRDVNDAFLIGNFGIGQDSTEDEDAPAQIADDVAGLAATVAAAAEAAESVDRFIDGSRQATSIEDLLSIWRGVAGASEGAKSQPLTAKRNPYRGLHSFTRAHEADFHGRDSAVSQLLTTMKAHRLVSLVGPSGVGKSSVVQAGLVPQLSAGALPGSHEWFIISMTPGSRPFESFASAVLRGGTTMLRNLDEEVSRDERGMVRTLHRTFPDGAEVVLIIDQFEELFTLAATSELRERFIEALVNLVSDPQSNTRVVVTLRADFFDLPLAHPALGELLNQSTVPLAAPTQDELRQMIEEPAAGVGVAFDGGLVDRICIDLRGEPGRLPLLEYALREMFDARSSDVISLRDYEAVGGVLGALGKRAESTIESISSTHLDAVRQTFLRLVRIDDSGTPTRRRVLVSELNRLDRGPHEITQVIRSFAEHRLLTLDRDPATRSSTVEVAHEALFREWPRLASWIDDRSDDLATRQKLLAAAEEWDDSDRDDGMLLSPGKLARFEEWLPTTDLAMGSLERDIVETSRAAADAAKRRRSRTRSLALGAVSLAAVVALILAIVATTTANRARLLAAESLVGGGRYLMTTGLTEEAAIGLVESYGLDPSNTPVAAMGQIINGREVWGTAIGDVGDTGAVRPAVDWNRGVVAVSGSTTTLSILSLDDGRLIEELGVQSPVSALTFLEDGRLVTGDEEGHVVVWTADRFEPSAVSASFGARIWDIVATGSESGILTTEAQGDAATSVVQGFRVNERGAIEPATQYPIESLLGPDIAARGFSSGIEIVRLLTSPEAGVLVTLGSPTLVASWDLETGDPIRHNSGSNAGAIWGGAISPNGAYIATGHQNRTLTIYDATTLEPLSPPTPPASGQQRSLFFTPEGDRLISSGQGGVLAWRFTAGTDGRPPILGTNPDVISATTALFTQRSQLSPDGRRVVAAVGDRVRMFTVDRGATAQPTGVSEELRDVMVAGDIVWIAGRTGTLYEWNRATGETTGTDLGEGLQAVAPTSDPSTVITGSRFGTLGLTSHQESTTEPAHTKQIWAIEWSPDQSVIATASADNTIAIRDPATLQLVRPPFGPDGEPHASGLKALAFVDTRILATVGGDGHLRTWDIATGAQVLDVPILDNQVNAIVLIEQNRVAVGDETGTITIVDTTTGAIEAEIDGHTSAIRGLAVAPDGRTVASGSQDNTVRLWDTATTAEVGILRHTGAVRAVAFNDDGTEVVAVDINGGAVVWDATWWTWPDRLCQWLSGWDIERSWPAVMGSEPFDPTCSP